MRREVPWTAWDRFILALPFLIVACDKETPTVRPEERNHSPEIQQVSLRPERVLAAQEVVATCRARDVDQDFLKYWWTATGGEFPAGNLLPAVTWVSPPLQEEQTLRVSVTDFQDTVTTAIGVEIARVAPPASLDFVNGANVVSLEWEPALDVGISHWSGYEVFVSHESMAGLPEDLVLPHLRTTQPIDRLEYRVTGLLPGQRVFCQVRSRRDYGGVVERSEAGPEIETAARMDGFGREPLFEIASRRGAKGIHLPGGELLALEVQQRDQIDLYLGTSDPEDRPGELWIKSPSLLAYRDAAWSDRVTRLKRLDGGWSTPIPPGTGEFVSGLPVVIGAVYVLHTTGGNYAKLRVLELRGGEPERRIEFQWAFQPIPGYPRF